MPISLPDTKHIFYNTYGQSTNPAVVLVQGLSMPSTAWPQEMIDQLVEAGLYVVSFDNRDIGKSKHYDEFKKPNLAFAIIKRKLGLRVKSDYSLSDMADDVVALMDDLNIRKASVIGVSMGGMIGQHLCSRYPQRVETFIQIMSTSGAKGIPGPSSDVTKHIAKGPAKYDIESILEYNMQTQRLVGTREHPLEGERLRSFVEANLAQGQTSAGILRQTNAIIADGDRSKILANIQAPTLVIHGNKDPLVHVEGGRDSAQKIPNAVIHEINNMGHDLPPSLIDEISQMCVRHIKANTSEDK